MATEADVPDPISRTKIEVENKELTRAEDASANLVNKGNVVPVEGDFFLQSPSITDGKQKNTEETQLNTKEESCVSHDEEGGMITDEQITAEANSLRDGVKIQTTDLAEGSSMDVGKPGEVCTIEENVDNVRTNKTMSLEQDSRETSIEGEEEESKNSFSSLGTDTGLKTIQPSKDTQDTKDKGGEMSCAGVEDVYKETARPADPETKDATESGEAAKDKLEETSSAEVGLDAGGSLENSSVAFKEGSQETIELSEKMKDATSTEDETQDTNLESSLVKEESETGLKDIVKESQKGADNQTKFLETIAPFDSSLRTTEEGDVNPEPKADVSSKEPEESTRRESKETSPTEPLTTECKHEEVTVVAAEDNILAEEQDQSETPKHEEHSIQNFMQEIEPTKENLESPLDVASEEIEMTAHNEYAENITDTGDQRPAESPGEFLEETGKVETKVYDDLNKEIPVEKNLLTVNLDEKNLSTEVEKMKDVTSTEDETQNTNLESSLVKDKSETGLKDIVKESQNGADNQTEILKTIGPFDSSLRTTDEGDENPEPKADVSSREHEESTRRESKDLSPTEALTTESKHEEVTAVAGGDNIVAEEQDQIETPKHEEYSIQSFMQETEPTKENLESPLDVASEEIETNVHNEYAENITDTGDQRPAESPGEFLGETGKGETKVYDDINKEIPEEKNLLTVDLDEKNLSTEVEKIKDVTWTEDETQNTYLESSLVKDNSETGLRDIVKESQHGADNQTEIPKTIAPFDSSLRTTDEGDENPEPKADVSSSEPEESMRRESKDLSPTEALTTERKHEGVMAAAGEDNVVAEEQDQIETPKHEEHSAQSFMQENDPTKENLESPLDVASEKIETTAHNEYVENITNIEEQRPAESPGEFLGEKGKVEAKVYDDINKEIPKEKNLLTADLDEKNVHTEVEKMKDVTSTEDENQNTNLESSLVKAESETGLKDIVKESQNGANNQTEILRTIASFDSSLTTTYEGDENPEPKADVSSSKPEESMRRESKDLSPTEALTTECKHEGVMAAAGEDNIVAEEQDQIETPKHEEHSIQSCMQETEPTKENLESPLDVASEETETVARNEYVEETTNIGEQRPVGSPREFLGETRKVETKVYDDINKEIPKEKKLLTVDLDEKNLSTEVEKDETQNTNLESSLVKEESETRLKDIVEESQHGADNQTEVLKTIATFNSSLSETDAGDENPEPKADVSSREPEENTRRESKDLTQTEALTMECKHEGVTAVAREENIVAEEQEQFEKPKHEEHSERSFLQKAEPTKENLESPLDMAPEEIETTPHNEYVEETTNIGEQRSVGSPGEFLGETGKFGTEVSDDINKKEIPDEKNLSTVDVDEKNTSTEVEIPDKNDNDLCVTNPHVEEAVNNRGEKQDEVSTAESGDQVQEALEVSKEEEKHVNETYEATKSPDNTILEHTSTEGAASINELEKGCELNTEEELKEINTADTIKQQTEEKEKAADEVFQTASKSCEEDIPVTHSTPLSPGEEADPYDQEDKSRPNSSEEAAPESDIGDQSCRTSDETKNSNDLIINEQEYEGPIIADRGEDKQKEMKNEEHNVTYNSLTSTCEETTKCFQENETDAKCKAEVGIQLAESFKENAVQESSQQDEVSEQYENIRTSMTIEESAITDLPSSYVGEKIVEGSLKEDNRDALRSEEEISNSNTACIEQTFDATCSSEEREGTAPVNEAEPNQGWKASSVAEISEKEIKEEISEKADTKVTVAAEDASLNEAEEEYTMQADSSNLVSGEKGLETTATSENGSKTEDQTEIAIAETCLDSISEQDLHASSPLSLEEPELVTAERSHAKEETPFVEETTEERIMEMEVESVSAKSVASIDIEKETANSDAPEQEMHAPSQLNNEKLLDESDKKILKMVSTSEVQNSSEIGKLETSKDENSSDIEESAVEQEESAKKFENSSNRSVKIEKASVEFDEAEDHSHGSDASEAKSISTLTEKHIKSVEDGEKLGSASESMAQDNSDELESVKQLPREIERADEIEINKEPSIELCTIAAVEETVDQVEGLDLSQTRSPQRTASSNPTETVKPDIAEDLNQELEASPPTKAFEEEIKKAIEKPADVSNSVAEVSEEKINEEEIGHYDGKTDIEPTAVTQETNLGEVELNEEPVKDFGTSSDAKNPEPTKTADTNQEGSEVDSMKLEETSTVVSQLPIHAYEKADNESISVEKSDALVEVEEIKNPDAVPEPKHQGVEEIHEPGTSLTVRDICTNEIERRIREDPQPLSEPINQGAEAASNDDIIAPACIREISPNVVPVKSLHTSPIDAEVEENRIPDAASESIVQGAKEIHDIAPDQTLQDDAEDDTNGIEEQIGDASETLFGPINRGVEAASNDGIAPGLTIQAEKIEEQLPVSSSAVLSREMDGETTTTMEKPEAAWTEKDDPKVDTAEIEEHTRDTSEELSETINQGVAAASNDEIAPGTTLQAEKIEEQLQPLSPVVLSGEEDGETKSTTEKAEDGCTKKVSTEVDTNETEEQIRDTSEALSEPVKQGAEAASNDEIAPGSTLQVEKIEAKLELPSSATKDDTEVDTNEVEEQSQDAPNELSEPTKQGVQAASNDEIAHGQTLQAEQIEEQLQVSPSAVLSNKEDGETTTSIETTEDGCTKNDDTDVDRNKIEEQVRDAPKALSEIINQGVEAASNDEIGPGQTPQAEEFEKELQVSSSPLLFNDTDGETITKIEMTEDGCTEKDDMVDNLNVEETPDMCESTNNAIVEKSDADIVTETKTLDAVSDPKDQNFEESHEIKTSPTAEITDTDKTEEEIKATETISNQGVEAVADGQTPDQPVPVGKLEEQLQVPTSTLSSSTQDCETGTTIEKIESESTKQAEAEVDNINLEEATALLSKFPTAEHEDVDKESATVEKSESNEIGVEEAKISEAISESKLHGAEELHEIGPSPTEGKTHTDDVAEEIKAPENIFQSSYQGVEAIIHEDTIPNQTLPIDGKEQPREPSSALLKEHDHEAITEADITNNESTKKDETRMNENAADSFEAGATEKPSLQNEGPRELEVSNFDVMVDKDPQNRAPEEESTVLEEDSTVKPQQYSPEIKHAAFETEHEKTTIHCSSGDTSKYENTDLRNSDKDSGSLPSPHPTIKELSPGEVDKKCEEVSNLDCEKTGPVLESVSEIQSLEAPPISEETDITKEQLEGAITESRDAEYSTEETTKAREAILEDTSMEKITEEKEVARISEPASPHEETVTKSNQEGEIKAEHYPGETNETFETKRSEIQHEELFEEDEKAGADKSIEETIAAEVHKGPYQISDGERKANFLPPEEAKDGKNVDKNKVDEINVGDTATEATTLNKEVQSFEKMLIKHEEDKTGDNSEETVMKKNEQQQLDFTSDQRTTEAVSILEEGKSIKCEEEHTKDEGAGDFSTIGKETELDEAKIHSTITANEDKETQPLHENPDILSDIKDTEVSHEELTMKLDEINENSKDTQEQEKASLPIAHEQIARKSDLSESTETTNATVSIGFPLVQEDTSVKAFHKAEDKDLKTGYTSGAEPEGKVAEQEEEKTLGGECQETTEKSKQMDSAKISLSNLVHGSTRETLQVVEHLTEEKEVTSNKEELQTETAETARVEEAKTDEEKDEEWEGGEHKRADGTDAPVMVEALRDMDVKSAHKKSHNILSGVGSKVKHSLAKVKKAITGKSSHPKTSYTKIGEEKSTSS